MAKQIPDWREFVSPDQKALEELWEKNADEAKKLNRSIWRTVWNQGAAETYINAQKSAAGMLKQPYTVNPKQVMNYYNKHGLELVKTLTETDKNTFKKALGSYFDADYEGFKSAFGGMTSDYKFKRIWNTERHNALTHGYDDFVKDQIKKNDLRITKTWHHSGNPHPRPHHIAMHGITVACEEDFPNGEDVPEGINCGCWLEYRELPSGEPNPDLEAAKSEYASEAAFIAALGKSENMDNLRSIWNTKHPDVSLDYDNVDFGVGKQLAIGINTVYKDLPKMSVVLGALAISSLPAEDEVWSDYVSKPYVVTHPENVVLNGGFFEPDSISNLQTSLKRDETMGFHPYGSAKPEFLMTHELGHKVWENLDNQRKTEIATIISEVGESGELENWGEYAKVSTEEAFAEIFASIYHQNAQDQPDFLKNISLILFRGR